MKNRSSYAVLTRFGIIAAILAALVLIAPAVSAADPIEIDYPENGEDPVAEFSASDPDADADDIEWSLEGVDDGIFKISDEGVLTFDKKPNFEDAKDGDEDTAAAGDQRAGDNVYKVTVVASGGKQAVEVTVTDEDEPGKVTFDQPQPQATRGLVAMGPGDPDADVDDVSWQWSRCTTKDNADDCTDIAGATTTSRSPTTDDVLMYLRATATYTDTHGDQTASAATDNPVEPRTLANAAPEFDDIDPITVNENVKGNIGEPIMATDGDNDILLYGETVDTGDNALFSVSSDGQISLDDKLDYEAALTGGKTANDVEDDGIPDGALTYTVMVKATDPSSATGTSSVDVYLMDVEETPKFPDGAPKELMVVEGGTQLTKPDGDDGDTEPDNLTGNEYDASDAITDGGDGDTPVYGIEGADKGKFGFTTDGAVLTLSAAADFEKQNSYSITLTVTDENTDNFNKLDVTVKVVDAEDDGEVDLSAREPQNGSPVIATLDDPDGGETAVKWQWYRGGTSATTVEALLNLTPATATDQNETCTAADATPANVATADDPCIIGGQTSALYTPGDDDEGLFIQAVATYKDAQNAADEENARGISERVVQDADPANTAPVFPDQDLNTAGDQSDTAMRSVAENMKGVNVGEPLEAADQDLLTYKLTGSDADSFSIDDPAEGSNSVQIKTAVKLDFEAQSMHTVVLTASDPSGATDSITVMIEVTDGPDNAVISLTETACEMDGDTLKCTYAENGDDAVETFTASDPDADAGDIEWSLEGVDDGIFKISDDGVLTFDKKPNFEDPKDGDEDTGSAGDQRAKDNVYKVTVVASGGKQAVEVTVTDEDEPGKVTFNQPQPQATRGLVASGPGDPDADVDDVSWQWSRCETKDNADDCTDIAGATTTSRSPSADDVDMYLRATATYTDTHGDQSASAATDNPVEPRTSANAAPKFDDLDPIEVNENVKGDIGEPIMATDGDNDILLYGKDGNAGDNALFSVNSGGQISLDDVLDYENPGTDKTANTDTTDDIPDDAIVYTVMVKATDPSGAEGKSSVDVYLMDVEETPKFGDDAPKALWVTEGETQLRTTEADPGDSSANLDDGAYTATDPGEGDTPVYGKEGADAGKFGLAGAVLTLSAAADYDDATSYSITLTVTDATADNFNKLDVTVKVVDAEDTGEVDLSAREPQNGFPVVATLDDPDGGETAIKWQWYRGGDTDDDADSLTGLNHDPEAGGTDVCTAADAENPNVAAAGDPCVIGGQTSALYTPGDDDETHLIHAVATYKDAQDTDTEETAIGSSEREVQEANPANTAPKFPDQDLNTAGDQSDTAMRSVAENAKGADVGEPLEAADADLLTYKLTGSDADSFSIDDPAEGSNSVQIKTAVKLDFEAQSMHTVVLTATDPSGAQDSITVMIEVTDGPDDAVISLVRTDNAGPAFEGATASRSVDENMPADTNVGDAVAATDEDDDTVTYSLSGSAYFEIDSATGQISTTMMLDYEAMSSHTVTVMADDGSGVENATASIDVTVMVGDAHPDCTVMDNMGLTNDCEALLDAKADLGGDDLDWDAGTAVADWQGVTMSDGRVSEVWLRDEGLDGSVSAALGRLDMLTVLNLHTNSLSGPIPDLSGASMLEELYLANNAAEDADGNRVNGPGLTGEIPAWLNGMANMRELWLWGNSLSGSVPDLSGMTSLDKLKLANNDLDGGLPTADMLPPNMTWLIIDRNPFGGEIPDLSSLSGLRLLWLHSSELTGSVPSGGMLPASLDDLNLRDNMLSGDIPDLSALDNLTRLRLHNNSLSGVVPGSLGGLDSLKSLWLHNETDDDGMLVGNNMFTSIEDGVGDLADTLEVIALSGNPWADDACVPADLADVATNDYGPDNIEVCPADDGS